VKLAAAFFENIANRGLFFNIEGKSKLLLIVKKEYGFLNKKSQQIMLAFWSVCSMRLLPAFNTFHIWQLVSNSFVTINTRFFAASE